jgi:two-component system, sensor histidine kinase PdtaS
VLRNIRAMRRWPLWWRLVIAGLALAATCLFQIPLEQEVPGEPFLLFFLVVIGMTLAFGTGVGFACVGLSTFLSLYFFEPFGTLALRHAADLIKIELYAILASGCVASFAFIINSLIAANEKAEALKGMDESKSILLQELAHGVANNFATVAALIRIKSGLILDAEARSVLDEALEQVTVMGRVHRRLRAGDREASLDSAAFIQELCEDFKVMVRGRPLSIECRADSRLLTMDQAVALGLLVNELVTNAMKHAFPDGRAGHIRIGFEVLKYQWRLSVGDDGNGFQHRSTVVVGAGQGQELVRGLSRQLGGDLQFETTERGTTFRLSVPLISIDPQSVAAQVH